MVLCLHERPPGLNRKLPIKTKSSGLIIKGGLKIEGCKIEGCVIIPIAFQLINCAICTGICSVLK